MYNFGEVLIPGDFLGWDQAFKMLAWVAGTSFKDVPWEEDLPCMKTLESFFPVQSLSIFFKSMVLTILCIKPLAVYCKQGEQALQTFLSLLGGSFFFFKAIPLFMGVFVISSWISQLHHISTASFTGLHWVGFMSCNTLQPGSSSNNGPRKVEGPLFREHFNPWALSSSGVTILMPTFIAIYTSHEMT
jgi:hypothetical protein